MSVFWDEGRDALARFCRESRQPPNPGGDASPFNHLIQPDPDRLLRVSIAAASQRGRLKAVYNVLQGEDIDTGEFSSERRERQFALLREAQGRVLDLSRWHQFLSEIVGAGFRSRVRVRSRAPEALRRAGVVTDARDACAAP